MDSLQKIWTSGISWSVSKVSQARQFSSTQSTLASFQHSNFVTNSHFECCMRPLRCTDNDRYRVVDSSNVHWFNLSALPPLTYTDSPLSGWPIVGTNFSEWVQIFQKNLFWGNGSKLKMTFALFSLVTRYTVVMTCVTKTLKMHIVYIWQIFVLSCKIYIVVPI